MNIRPFADADLEPVAALFTASVHDLAATAYDAAQRAAWAPRPPDLTAWRERLRSLQTWVAFDGDELAGFISVEADGHIDLLYTAPSHARRGVASALYTCIEKTLRSAGVSQMYTEASLVARPCFEAFGFSVEEEQTVQRHGVSLRRFRMRKPLSAIDAAPSLTAHSDRDRKSP